MSSVKGAVDGGDGGEGQSAEAGECPLPQIDNGPNLVVGKGAGKGIQIGAGDKNPGLGAMDREAFEGLFRFEEIQLGVKFVECLLVQDVGLRSRTIESQYTDARICYFPGNSAL